MKSLLGGAQFTDNLSGKTYRLVNVNAAELSQYLRNSYKNKGIDYNKFNSEMINTPSYRIDEVKKGAGNPPLEIYEYQNLFLIEKDGEYLIADGFRRLLWYNAPDININVRIYNYSDFTSSELLLMMVRLNNWKFYGEGSYHDRGFALMMKSIYDIDVLYFSSAFDGYLYGAKIKADYGYGDNRQRDHIDDIKQRITNDMFIGDMRFLETIKRCGCMVNKFVGVMIHKFRIANPDKQLDSSDFVQRTKKKVIQDLMPKYEKLGNDITGSQAQKIINQITELYHSILLEMSGKEPQLTYAEKIELCKKQVEDIKKDKKYTLVTKPDLDRELFSKLCKFVEDGGKITGKAVIIPTQDTSDIWGTTDNILSEWVPVKRHGVETANKSLVITCKFGDRLFRIGNQTNMTNFISYTTKYFAEAQEIKEKQGYGSRRLKAYLFIETPEN